MRSLLLSRYCHSLLALQRNSSIVLVPAYCWGSLGATSHLPLRIGSTILHRMCNVSTVSTVVIMVIVHDHDRHRHRHGLRHRHRHSEHLSFSLVHLLARMVAPFSHIGQMCDAHRYTLIPAIPSLFLQIPPNSSACFWDWRIRDTSFSKLAWKPGTVEPLLLFACFVHPKF